MAAGGSRSQAFGGVVEMAGDVLLAVYREAASHVSTDSKFVKRTSTDQGVTWSAASTIYDPAIEVADIGVSYIGGVVIVSFFDWDGTAGGYTARTMRSFDEGVTWDTPVAVTTHGFGAYAAAGAPIVVAANGDWLLPLYGLDSASDTFGYCRLVKSTNGGTSWSALSVLSAKAFGDTSEPNIALLDDGSLICMLRQDIPSLNIYKATSTDHGATWSAPSLAIASRNGSPAVLQMTSGELRVMYRAGNGGPCRWRNSWDRGATWSAEMDFTESMAGAFVYGQWVQLTASGPGATGVLWSMEDALGVTSSVNWQRFNDDAAAP